MATTGIIMPVCPVILLLMLGEYCFIFTRRYWSGKLIPFYFGVQTHHHAPQPTYATAHSVEALIQFPLLSKCGKIAHLLEENQNPNGATFHATLDGCPGGPDAFLVAVKFCYGVRMELTPKNIIMVYCVADYLEMTEDYAEENLLAKSEGFFHKVVLHNWKDCILALQSSESAIPSAGTLQLVSKSLNALSMMACTDPSLFGWPMMMYGSLQSPGGSILWNGINTGARIRSSQSDWWFEDISYLSAPLFEKLIETMKVRGLRPESIAGAVMHYARKYLPGLSRWQGGKGGNTGSVASLSMTPSAVDQRDLLERIETLLPLKKGKSFCRFLLGLLRVAMILNVSQSCTDSLEKRIGMQLELATLDGLLIPNYSDSDNLYSTDCVERIIRHFLSSEPGITSFSPVSVEMEMSSSSSSIRKIVKLIDNYLAEIAPDVNLKPEKMRLLAEALPESSRSLDDGLYRALDIYFKAHPWLSDNEKEKLCNVINFQKLSIEACAHASQNGRLPLRVLLQVLFFEQLQMKISLSSCLRAPSDGESTAPAATDEMAGRIPQRDDWVTVVRANRVLRVDMEKMGSRVRELEQEIVNLRQEMQKMTKSNSSRLVPIRIGCNLLPWSSDAQPDTVESLGPSPRASVEQAQLSRHSRHRKSFSVL